MKENKNKSDKWKPTRRLRTQVTMVFVALTVATVCVVTFNAANHESQRITANILQSAQELAGNLATTGADYLLERDYASIEKLLLRTGRFPGVAEIQIADETGKILGDIYRGVDNEISARYRQPALVVPSQPEQWQVMQGESLVVWRPVELGHLIGWVRVVYDLKVIDEVNKQIWRDSILLMFLLLATTVALLIIMLRRPLRAIEQYTEFANSLDSTQGKEMPVESSSIELSNLGNALNHASKRLSTQTEAIVKAMNELERVAALPEYNPNMSISLDARGLVTYSNPSADRMLKEDGNQAQHIFSYLPDNIDALRKECLSANKSKTGVEVNAFGRTLLWTFAPVEDQQVLHCYATDITKRRKAEQARKESEDQYRLLFDSANDAILLLRKGKCIDCNRMASILLGLPRDYILNQPLTKFAPPHQPGGKNSERLYAERLDEALAGEPQSFEWQCINAKRKQFYSEVSLNHFEVGGETWVLAIVRDITERKTAEEKLLHQANYDSLTELPNRMLALDRLSQAVKQAHRLKRNMALMFIDVDQFKKVNDSLGHTAGDQLLIEVGQRLQVCVREGDTVARLGGDEFLIILNNLNDVIEAEVVAERMLSELARPYLLQSQELYLSASIGITGYPYDSHSPTILLRNADAAMYQAKESGRNTYRFYTPEMNQRAKVRLEMESRLRKAIERNELSLNYQAQIDISQERVIGAEALLRWHNPELGFVPPDQFIHLAEDIGLMPQIGEWVLRQACQDALVWRQKFQLPLRVAVNVSPTQFRGNALVETVRAVMEEYHLPTDLLEIELTESLLVEDAPDTAATLQALKQMGICLALDDFGTGYSSLSYLKKYPFDVLKIDRSFINSVMTHPDDAALCQAIIAMAASLNLSVVGEGVETEDQLSFLRRYGAQIAQGYYYSKPLPMTEFETFLLVWNTKRQGKRVPTLS
ncbi:MAG: EAL domain-containing protein [Gammaproteobacteria bacterium]|nr:EAL domain-containing protein [Gammaproteobacteria bacterium]